MNIAICHHYSITFYSGGEKVLVSMAELLRDKGHRVKIHSLPLRRKPIKLSTVIKDIPYEEKWFHEVDADIAYVVYMPFIPKFFKINASKIAGIHGFILAEELCDKEVEKMGISIFLKHFGVLSTFARYSFKAFGKFELSSFNAVHIVNQALKARYASIHKHVFYIPNWIGTDFYTPRGDKNENFTVLFAGRHSWDKGFDRFVEACNLLKNEGYEFDYICTGRNEGMVKGLGFVEEDKMPETYSKSHVVVYPTRIDTFGLAILESLACGTPVITSSIEAHKSLHLPLIYADTPYEIARKIIDIYKLYRNNYESYVELCRKVHQEAQKYDVKKIFPMFESMLRGC